MSMIRSSLSRLALAVLAVAAPLLLAGCATTVPLAPASPGMFDDAHLGRRPNRSTRPRCSISRPR